MGGLFWAVVWTAGIFGCEAFEALGIGGERRH
jgi:hypothetical protein